MLETGLILLLFSNHYFTLVEENFENWLSETLQIGLIWLLSDNHYFTMVEENIEIWIYEMPQIGLIWLLFDNHDFTMGWRNFWKLINAPDWLNLTIVWKSSLHHGWRK